MRSSFKRSFSSLALALGLAAIVAVLAVLQYQWSGQVSEAQRQRMQATLRTAMNQFREDLHRELAAICASFDVNAANASDAAAQEYAKRYQDWRRGTSFPTLVANVYLWEKRYHGLFRLNPETGRFEATECSPGFSALCQEFKLKPDRGVGPPIPPFAWRLEGEIPALIRPLMPEVKGGGLPALQPEVTAYLIIELSPIALQRQVFPELVQRYFGGADGLLYQAAVFNDRDHSSALYISNPVSPQQIQAAPDAVIRLFGPRHEDRFGLPNEREPGVRVSRNEGGRQRFPALAADPELVRRFRSAIIVPWPEGPRWELVVKHSAGSVEDAVAALRRRNLAVGFGVLSVLAATLAMLVIFTRRAQRLARLQVEFVAGVSHELRTPLAVITSAADNLTDGVVDAGQRVRQYGKVIADEARRLSSMVEQILAFASNGAVAARYEVRPTDVTEIVDRTLGGFAAVIEESGFTLEKHIEPDLPPALADADGLAQCLQNLISNALKYGRAGRWLAVRGHVAGTARRREIEITIEDQGMGIESDDLPHVFEPFYRGRTASGTQVHGTGLGLSLAKRVTEAMHGSLSVASAPGKGTAFTLRLPAVAGAKLAAAPASEPQGEALKGLP